MMARFALPTLSGLLILLILAQWLMPDGGAQLAGPSSASGVGHRKAATILTLGAANLADEILARPLFLPGRRMTPPVVADAQPAALKETPLPRLSGIFLAGSTRVAIFQVIGTAKPVTAGVGDPVSAWKVTEIKPDAVKIKGATGVKTLFPTADADRTSAGADPALEQTNDDQSQGADQ